MVQAALPMLLAAVVGKVREAVLHGAAHYGFGLHVAVGFCYDGADSNCAKYGKLYDKVTIFRICKDGWRVPSKDDYDKLLKFLNSHTDYLKVFKPLRAGFRKEDGTYSLMDEKALFWSATEMTGQGECYVEFSDDNERGLHKCGGMVQNDALSLRCIKDS